MQAVIPPKTKIMKFELSQEQVKNLITLLGRVSLTGGEVPAYVDIINVLNKPITEYEKTKKV